MKGRTVAIFILSLVLVAVLGLCGLTTYSAFRWAKANNVSLYALANDTTSAQVTETKTFTPNGPLELVVDTTIGAVSVTADPAATQVTVETVKTGFGPNEADAKAAAEKLVVEMLQEDNKVSAIFRPPSDNRLTFGTYHPARVTFNVKVPPEAAVNLTTGNGDLLLIGTRGKAVLVNHFGNMKVTGVQGEVIASGSNSDITAGDIQAGSGKVELSTAFGSLTARNISAGPVQIANANGNIDLTGVRSDGHMLVHTEFGRVTLADISADGLEITSQNGDVIIRLSKVIDMVQVTNSFGKIGLTGVDAARYTLSNQNGGITLDGAKGALVLSSSFGDITVTHATDAALSLSNQNGKIAFTGTLDPQEAHSVESTFGDILLTIPAASAFQVEVETTFGKIQSNLPVTLSGEISDTKWTGQLNRGGPLLKIKNQNGSVRIEGLK